MKVCSGRLKAMIKSGDILLSGTILDSRTASTVEIFKEAGYDLVLIDREHTALNEETIADHIRTARCLDFPCMVRVAEDCYHELNRTLDQGPDGIFVPRIRTREQVEKLIETVFYKPKGNRGLAGSSCPIGKYIGWGSVVEQIETVNKNLVIGIQIETAEALNSLDDILSVPGIDVAVVGNDDLSMRMGIPGELEHPDYIAAVENIISACNKYSVMPGIAVGNAEKTIYWIKKGMRFFWLGSDVHSLYNACSREVNAVRLGVQELEKA